MPNILSGDILFLLELMVIRGRNNKHALCGNTCLSQKLLGLKMHRPRRNTFELLVISCMANEERQHLTR